ncbi:hypothetical protein V6N13_040920 [Hibiscus sabdariffa]|uniref:Uncharacterized protein n=1 Tax=Hibiscus sabdariffa TaxID=183260 RepID=A0ABR2R9V0_9ROSI
MEVGMCGGLTLAFGLLNGNFVISTPPTLSSLLSNTSSISQPFSASHLSFDPINPHSFVAGTENPGSNLKDEGDRKDPVFATGPRESGVFL